MSHLNGSNMIRRSCNTTKKRRLLSLVAVVFAAGLVLLTFGFFFGSKSFVFASAAEKTEISTRENLTPPLHSVERYNCVAVHQFTQNDGWADYIRLRPESESPYVYHDLYVYPGRTAGYVVLPVTPYTFACSPEFTKYQAYNPQTQKYSTLQRISTTQYGTTKYFVNQAALYFRSEQFPTEYDLVYNMWEHNASVFDNVHFSVAYKGIVADGQLTVPLLGTAEWSETITYSMFGTETSSVTFFVRIGPNKISVRASEVVECNNYDTMFAFEYFG